MAAWITGVLMGLVSLLGLVMAKGAADGPFEIAGFLIFLFGILMIFNLIAGNVGRHET